MEGDLDLLRSWQAGDKQAGSRLFARHFSAMRRFFGNKIADGEAEDLIQQCMLECVKASEAFRGHSSFRAYLFAIARRQLWHHVHRRSRDAGRREPDQTVSSLADCGLSPSKLAAHSEVQARIAEAMRRLPIDLQIALELHYWEQLTSSELGEVLGISPVTARTRLHRAREQLREMLSDLPESNVDTSITTVGKSF